MEEANRKIKEQGLGNHLERELRILLNINGTSLPSSGGTFGVSGFSKSRLHRHLAPRPPSQLQEADAHRGSERRLGGEADPSEIPNPALLLTSPGTSDPQPLHL